MKTLTVYFRNVEQVHLGKDVFLTPYYLGKDLNCNVRLLYPATPTNLQLPTIHRGVKMIPVGIGGKPVNNRIVYYLILLFYLFRYAIPSSYFMLFHYYNSQTVYLGLLYKSLNPFGKLYLKLDASITALKYKDDFKNIIQKTYWTALHKAFAKAVDCVSCETSIAMDTIKQSKASCYQFREEMVLMPNGFDEEEFCKYEIKVKSFEEKENIFITVGRIGTYPKNNEVMLDALSGLDLGNWKFYFIGGIEESFKSQIESFYKINPQLRDKVVFTGNISSKEQLWDYYNRAKVFVLTSRSESFALVYLEAARFGNYIVSTDTGAFSDIMKNGFKGECVPQDDPQALTQILSNIVDGKTCLSPAKSHNDISWSCLVKVVTNKLKTKTNGPKH